MKLLSIIFSLLCIELFSQSTQCIESRYGGEPLFDESEIVVDPNVEYGTAMHYWTGVNTSLLMDIYQPDPAIDPVSERPFILVIHGGSFIAGNKADMGFVCMEYAKRGFVAATINYRLGWDCDYTNIIALGGGDCFGTCNACFSSNLNRGIYMAVQDAHAAMRFIASETATYGIDSNWLFASGASAGSITALLMSTWSQSEAESIIPSGFSEEVGDLNESGNIITQSFEIKAVVNNCGAVLNPNHLNDNENMPIQSFHDSNDVVVPYASGPAAIFLFQFGFLYGSSVIYNTRISQQECAELHTVPGSLNHCGFPVGNLVELSSCFLKRVMCGVCLSYSTSDVNEVAMCSSLASVDVGIAGCTYSIANNYNPIASIDNGSCDFENTCPSDLNGDGTTNIADLLEFIAAYGTSCE
ncbi:MAG: alpha/beta hydrolase [Flavobacteriales bacterium]|nr:alpha/beta hydrolase [Flavobacteriales bacterium]